VSQFQLRFVEKFNFELRRGPISAKSNLLSLRRPEFHLGQKYQTNTEEISFLIGFLYWQRPRIARWNKFNFKLTFYAILLGSSGDLAVTFSVNLENVTSLRLAAVAFLSGRYPRQNFRESLIGSFGRKN